MDIIDPNNHYILAAGTEHERSVPLSKSTTLGAEGKHVFEGLLAWFQLIQARVGDQLHKEPMGTVILGIWTTWCYAAFDIDRLRKENQDLRNALELLSGRMDTLEAKVDAQNG